MRKLMWFSIGFALSCGFCAYILSDVWILPLGIAAAILTAAGMKWKSFRRAAFCGVGVLLGLAWCVGYRSMYLRPAMAADGETVTVTVTATDFSFPNDYGCVVDGTLELEGKRYSARVYVGQELSVSPGDTLTGGFRLRYTPGGRENATYHPGKGIFLLAYQHGELTHVSVEENAFHVAAFAKRCKDLLRKVFDADVFPFVQALLLGDATELDYATDSALKISGIRHIIAVSGLHVTILYSMISRLTLRRRWLTALLGFPALLLFCAAAGFTPSVTRACIMTALMMLAHLVNQEYDAPTALSFASLVMLLCNPMAITSVSFQLSVGCVAGILLFGNPAGEWLKARMGEISGKGLLPRIKRWIVSSVSVTLGSMSLTTPLSAWYFGTVSLVGILTNLLTLWVIQFVFLGIIGVCLIAVLSPYLAGMLAWVIGWLIRFVLFAAKILTGIPMGAVYLQNAYSVSWLIFVYLLLAVFLLDRKRRVRFLLCCGTVGLCLVMLLSWTEPLRGDFCVTVLDVGQGQSILLQSKGRTFLVDCGGDDDTSVADLVAGKLLSQGITRLDAVILTHCDRDHAGGIAYLLSRVKADAVFYPATESLSLENTAVYPVSEDLSVSFGDGEIRIFGPIYVSDANENSLCVLFTYEDYDILITGDRGRIGESALVRDKHLPDVELLIAGHHGSKHSTTDVLLEAVRPEYIFVSAGADNPYGHPAPEMLDRAAKYGCAVYRTDIHGTLTFRR